jgi:hypothetical protein
MVVSQINMSKVQYPVLGTTNCAWNQQDGNIVSIPKIKEGDSLKRFVSMSEDLPKQFLKRALNPELEPEPIPSYSSDLVDIMDRDAATLDRDVLSFLASCV